MSSTEQNTSSLSPPSNISSSTKVVGTLFWPRFDDNSYDGWDTTKSVPDNDDDDIRTKSIPVLQQQLKVGFIIGWWRKDCSPENDNDDGSSTTVLSKKVIVAGMINVLILNDLDNNTIVNRDSLLKKLQENRIKIKNIYNTTCSNIEYLKNMELPKSQQHQCLVAHDLSILGLFIDDDGTNMDITIIEDIFNWLSSSTINTANDPNSIFRSSSTVSSSWNLFIISHNKFGPRHVMVREKDSVTTKMVNTKQIVYYNSNRLNYTRRSNDPRKMYGVDNIQVLWDYNVNQSFSFSQKYRTRQQQQQRQQQEQPWLMQLTYAANITHLISDVGLKERLHPCTPLQQKCENVLPNPKNPPRFIRFLLRHSLFARHCYLNHTTTVDPTRSVFPIWEVLRRLLFKAKIRRALERDPKATSLLPLKDYNQIVHDRILELDQITRLIIDAVLGVMIGTILLYCVIPHLWMKDDDVSGISLIGSNVLNMIQRHYELLNRYLQYLEEFPLGFKLNQDLLHDTGCEIQRIWKLHEYITLSVIVPQFQSQSDLFQSLPILIVCMFSCVFGASGCMAFVFDIMHFGTLHMSIFAWLTIRIYYFELYLLSTLWKLFRGKKCNILRNHRTDSMEYDSMQLLVGTISFAIVLFLFTTIFVGHVFYTILSFITIMMTVPILLMYTSILTLPWGILWLRRQRPGWFTREIYIVDEVPHIQPEKSESMKSLDVTSLCFRPVSYNDILSETVFPRIQGSMRWIIQSLLLSMIGVSSSWNDYLETVLPITNAEISQ